PVQLAPTDRSPAPILCAPARAHGFARAQPQLAAGQASRQSGGSTPGSDSAYFRPPQPDVEVSRIWKRGLGRKPLQHFVAADHGIEIDGTADLNRPAF